MRRSAFKSKTARGTMGEGEGEVTCFAIAEKRSGGGPLTAISISFVTGAEAVTLATIGVPPMLQQLIEAEASIGRAAGVP